MKRTLLTLVILGFLTGRAFAACHVITPAGSGSNSGADWNNSCAGFSGNCSGANMLRGDTYYVGKGAYSSPNLTKAASGSTLITIKAPTAGDHCTATGFVQGTHVGQADLAGSLGVGSDYWVLDGQYGTETPGTGKGTFGIKIHWNGGTSQMPIAISGGGTGSTFRFLEVQGSNGADTGCDVGVRILGYNDTPNTNNVLIEHDYIYQSNNIVGVQVSDNVTVQNSILSENWSTASCHGENIAINGANGLTVRYNRFINCVGTGCIATPSSLHLAMTNFEVYGNIFYDDGRSGTCPGNFDCPGNGMVAIIDSVNVTGLKLYNNTVANWITGHTSSGNSLTFFQTGSGGTITGLDLRNNVFYNNVAMTASDMTPGTCNSNSYYNTTRASAACTGDATGLSGSPFVNAVTAPQNFHLTSDTSAWNALSSPYNVDPDGITRTSSRGAFQMVSGGAVPGSPFVANLSVTGVAPAVTLAPASINFGNQPNGSFSAPQSFSLSNTGTSTLTFTISKVGTNPGDFVVTTQCAGSLAPGASCPITVVFEPTTTGARSATVRITDNASGSPHDGAVSGTGIATASAVCLSVNSVNFGNQPVSTSSGTQPVVVTNCGTANLVISAVTPTGNFSSTGCVTTVAVNATCTINGTFTPASAGTLTGQFSIASNSASSPDLVTLSGFGTQTGATLTSTAAFGHVVVGVTSPTIPLTLTNTGNTSLNLNTPAISGSNPGDYSFGTSCGLSLAPNATCQLSATFTPTTTGARSATLTQSFTGGPTSVTSALSGTGDAATPAVTLTPATLDFGSVTTGVTSTAKTVQVQNSGNAVLNITSITLTGTNAADYARTNNCGATLAAGAVCTVDVTVTPGGTGARTANLHLIDDAADTPQNVTMTANGVAAPAPAVSLSPASLSFSPPSIQTTTTSGAQNITATNTGNANLVVSVVTLSGANPGDFTISNNCSTVSAGNTCSATVNCVPTAAGSRSATVSFASNAASSPDTAAISCTGFVGTPTILLAVTNINFGNQTVGTVSGPATFTLTNTGLATATNVAITTVGDFAVTDNCGGSITQGSSCSATVTFSPLVLCGQTDPNDPNVCLSHVHLGSVRVVSNTSNSPQTVNLQGTAIPVAPPPGPIIMGVGGKITIGGRLTVN